MILKFQLTISILTYINCLLAQSISPLNIQDPISINQRSLQRNEGSNNSNVPNCEVFDSFQKTSCLKCQDKLLLPDCTKCPIGYKLVDNKCESCGDHQLYCGSSNDNDYCYKGFTKTGTECVCLGGKIQNQNNCLMKTEIAYTESYVNGSIIIKFSSEVKLSTLNPFSTNAENCEILENYNNANGFIGVNCYLDNSNPKNFYIKLDGTIILQQQYAIIPKIQEGSIQFKSDSSLPSALIYQPSYLTSEVNPHAYFGYNDFTQKQCYFNKPLYYIDVNKLDSAYTVYTSEFVKLNNQFQQSGPTFTFFNSKGLSTLEQLQFYQAFVTSQYPQNNAQIPLSIVEKPGLTMSLSFICLYPYNLISSNTVTFKTVSSLESSCSVSMKNQGPYYNDDRIPIIFSCGINNVDLEQDDQFYVFVRILTENDEPTNKYYDMYVQLKDFPFTYELPSYVMNFGATYKISIDPSFYGEPGILSKTQPIQISRKPLQVKILGGSEEDVDPRDQIKLYGSVTNPAFENKPQADFTYTWKCYDEVLKADCVDEKNIKITFEPKEQVTIEREIFDFNGIYTFTLDGYDIQTLESNQAKFTLKTMTGGQLSVIYDNSYDTKGIIPDELLKFQVQYNGADKLKNSYLNHTFQIGYNGQLTKESQSQRENIIYTKLVDNKIPDDTFKSSINFYMRFFVYDVNSKKLISLSKKIYFKSASPPYDCKLVFDPALTGDEVAFVDKNIRLRAIDCKSSKNDGKLFYQFLYYNEEKYQNKEKNFPDILYRKYLTKFQESNEIETYLPPGKIVFVVVVKDSQETKVRFSSTITIKKNTFDQLQYETFLENQNSEADTFKKQIQYDKQVCTYGMMIECIEDFESANQSLAVTDKVAKIKIQLKEQLLILPGLISNDLMSQNLQEFTVRSLNRLYNTENGPDSSNQINRLNEVSELVKKRIDLMKTLKPFIPEVRDTYRKKMLITLDITAQTIGQLSITTMKTPSTSWSNRQIKEISQNLEALALTLYVNQQSISWETDVVNVQVQKVDKFNFFKNYLDFDINKYGDSNIDSNQIYNVEFQNWKENIYSFEKGYQDMVQPYISKTQDQQIISYLQQTYPAVYPKVTKSFEVNRLLRQLEEEEFLELPANIRAQFDNLKGNQKVKCTQRIKDVWTKSSCTTKVTQTDKTFSVSCSCSSPSYTSIIADVEALFENENFSNIFSEAGINAIFSLKNWYKYSAIYVLIGMNVAIIASFVIGIKLDKADASIYGQHKQATLANALLINGKEKENDKQKSPSEQTNSNKNAKNNEFQTRKSSTPDQSPKYCGESPKYYGETPKYSDGSPNFNGYPQENDKNISLLDIKEVDFETRSPTKATIHELNKDYIKNASKSIFERKCTFEHPQKWEQTQPTLKLIGETNLQIPYSEQSCKDVVDVCTMYRINFVECQDKDQHNYQFQNDLKKFQTCDVDADKFVTPQEEKPKLSKKELAKQEKEEKQRLQKEKDSQVQKKSFEFLKGMSIFKGTCVFHDLLQIFVAYNKDESRLFRFSIFYNQLIWLLTLSATFGEKLTIVQVIALSVISSVTFGIFKVILKFTLHKKAIRIIGYVLIFCFLVFCYYAILVVMGSQEPGEVNGWIINYVIAQCIDIFISGVISSAVKYFLTLKFLPIYQISHLVYKITSADALFGIFQ